MRGLLRQKIYSSVPNFVKKSILIRYMGTATQMTGVEKCIIHFMVVVQCVTCEYIDEA